MTQLDDVRTLYYRNSGKTPVVRLLMALVTIIPAVALGGAVYALIASYLPMLRFAKLILLLEAGLMAGFAFAVGGLTGKMLMWARVRNLAMVWVVALLAAAAAWYASWVVWEWHVVTQNNSDAPRATVLFVLLTKPNVVWELATEINQYGTFGMAKGDPIRGAFLWVLWMIEAGVVLGVASVVPYRMVRRLAFCESCQKWGRNREGILSVAPAPDEDRLRARLALKDLSALEELGPADMNAPRRLRVDLQNCESCNQMHLLSVYRVDVSYDKNGHRTDKARPLVDRLWLDPEQAQMVQEIKDRLYGGTSAPATAPVPVATHGTEGQSSEDAPADQEQREAASGGDAPRRSEGGVGL